MNIFKTSSLTLLLMLATASAAFAVIATDWQTVSTSTAQGNLGGVTVSVTNAGSPGAAAAILYYDLSGPGFAPYQLAASQETLDYAFNENWNAAFNSPITNLMLYCKFWRGPNSGPLDPPNFEYEFDQPFTILTGFGSSSISGNTLIVPSIGFQDGILLFTGPVSSVGLLSNNGNNGSRQELTFGVQSDPVATENASWDAVKSLYR